MVAGERVGQDAGSVDVLLDYLSAKRSSTPRIGWLQVIAKCLLMMSCLESFYTPSVWLESPRWSV